MTLAAVARRGHHRRPAHAAERECASLGWVYVDIRGRDLGSFVREAQQAVAEQVSLPPGYSIAWSGQFEYLERRGKAHGDGGAAHPAPSSSLLLYLTFRNFWPSRC